MILIGIVVACGLVGFVVGAFIEWRRAGREIDRLLDEVHRANVERG